MWGKGGEREKRERGWKVSLTIISLTSYEFEFEHHFWGPVMIEINMFLN